MAMKSSSFKLLSHLFTHPTSPPFNLSRSQLRLPHPHPHRPAPHHPSSLRAFSDWLPPPCRISSSLSRRNIWQTPKFPQRLVYPMDEYSIFPMLRERALDTNGENHNIHDKDDVEDYETHGERKDVLALQQARRILRLVQVESIKEKLKMEKDETMDYAKFLSMCRNTLGLSSTTMKDAKYIAKLLDEVGIILIFQDVVYLKPHKVAQLVTNVIPKPLSPPEQLQSLLQEVSLLEEEKKEIDRLADKHSRRVLWCGFGYFAMQTALIFRLTFWELSWDVMEPIAYFVTTFNLLVGYAFFMVTSREPNYQDVGRTLFSSKQQKLIRKRNFDIDRLFELKKQCQRSHLGPHLTLQAMHTKIPTYN